MLITRITTNSDGCITRAIDHSLYMRHLLKDEVKQYILRNFGERCDPPIEGDVPCGCCEAWKAYDTLFGWEEDSK